VTISGTSPCSSVTSTPAILTVNQGVAITTQPASQTLCSGSSVTFNVAATGTGLAYQWYKDGVQITGANSSSYTINNVSATDAAGYTAVVSGTSPCSPVTSSPAILTVNQIVAINTQPASLTLCTGSDALSV